MLIFEELLNGTVLKSCCTYHLTSDYFVDLHHGPKKNRWAKFKFIKNLLVDKKINVLLEYDVGVQKPNCHILYTWDKTLKYASKLCHHPSLALCNYVEEDSCICFDNQSNNSNAALHFLLLNGFAVSHSISRITPVWTKRILIAIFWLNITYLQNLRRDLNFV